MRIPRLHLFELEDFSWFPAEIRNLATDYLHFHRPAVPLVAKALKESRTTEIVDLCSGAAGSIHELVRDLEGVGHKVNVIVTDKFPNLSAFERVAAESGGRTSFRKESIDASSIPRDLPGLRTVFNAFHHFNPSNAIEVLRDAVQAGQPIAILEIPERSLRNLVPMILLTPLMVLIATPFIRPFRWRRLLWTYVVPLVPLTSWWDGIVSQLRAYTPDELSDLATAVRADGYCWKAGKVPIKETPGEMTFLIGIPDSAPGNLLHACE